MSTNTSAQEKKKWAFPLGIVIVVLAVIGLVTVIIFAVRGIGSLTDNSDKFEKYEQFLSPVIMNDPDPFDDVSGAQMLAGSNLRMIRLAAEIAATHHENWDGSGYPNGLEGEDIPISGRITALADVFDALGSKRCYKEPWPREKIIEFIRGESGRKFDPRMVDFLIENLDGAEQIRVDLPD